MFNKFMNNYYFGKSGKGDFTPDDLPDTRWQLFLETLRTRFSQLLRLNLIYLLIWIPTIVLLMFTLSGTLNVLSAMSTDTETAQTAVTETAAATETVSETAAAVTSDVSSAETQTSGETAAAVEGETTETIVVYTYEQGMEYLKSIIWWTLIFLFPCIAITGPFTAGMCYVTRNWSRDEHAFIWSDFKDAMKANWKQSLVISTITGAMPFILYIGWSFYGGMASSQVLMIIPQVLLLMVSILWSISVTYMHPLIVTYELSLKDVIRNAFILSVARLPMSVGIRLLHCVPVLLFIGVSFLVGYPQWGIMLLFLYYVLIGFSMSRFISASYTNAVFDKYINPRIEGAAVNRGLREQDEEEDDDEEEDEEKEEDNEDEKA